MFVGNLGFNTEERDIEEFFKKERMGVHRIRILKDQDGKSKGAAFVEFEQEEEVDKACKFDGKELGSTGRRLRINPAGSKP